MEKIKKLIYAWKWYLITLVTSFIIFLLLNFYNNSTHIVYSKYTFNYWREAIEQVAAILLVGSISIWLVQLSIYSIRQIRKGVRFNGTILLVCCGVGVVIWCPLYVFLLMFSGGGFLCIFMLCLPFSIPLYYVMKNSKRYSWFVYIIIFLLCLIYVYKTIDLKGPIEFAITDRPVDIPATWFYSYTFYRIGMILSDTFIYSSIMIIIIKLVKFIYNQFYHKEYPGINSFDKIIT